MKIKVYNNNELVHDGSLTKFLQDNQNDQWLTHECKQLNNRNKISLQVFSEIWEIEKQTEALEPTIKDYINRRIEITYKMRWDNCISQHTEKGITKDINNFYQYKDGELVLIKDNNRMAFIPVQNIIKIKEIA